mmetsp:Transcript_85759/g.175070  ORF Transcript_85759/g.175070 Transcript_85759/m.175070 type:complete len:192 (+) Transcript_85759:82-657(+)
MDEIQRRRQELRDEAYYLVLKALILRDRPDTALFARMRLELGIPNETHRTWIADLKSARDAGALTAHIEGPRSFAQPAFQMPQPSMTPRNRINPAEAARKAKAQQATAHYGQVAHPPPIGNLPPDPVHFKVQFYRKADGWQEGLITEYMRDLGKVRVAVLNTKKVEVIDYRESNCLVVHSGERVTDLSNYI